MRGAQAWGSPSRPVLPRYARSSYYGGPQAAGVASRGLGCPRRARERRGRTHEAPGSAGDDSIRPVVRTLRVGRRNHRPRRVSGRAARGLRSGFPANDGPGPMECWPSPYSPGAVLAREPDFGRMAWTWQDARTRTRTRKRKRTRTRRHPRTAASAMLTGAASVTAASEPRPARQKHNLGRHSPRPEMHLARPAPTNARRIRPPCATTSIASRLSLIHISEPTRLGM